MTQLFEATNGPHWHRRDGWMEGEPCVDSWEGITCCPEQAPYYRRGVGCRSVPIAASTTELRQWAQNRSRFEQLEMLSYRHMAEPNDTYPVGCSSGNVTGTTDDLARCVVVEIDLSLNRLAGELVNNISFDSSLPWLQELRLDQNGLVGRLPDQLRFMPHLSFVDVSFNYFDYTTDQHPELMRACAEGSEIACAGLPQDSCSAYGPLYRLKVDHTGACVRCDWPGAAFIAAFIITTGGTLLLLWLAFHVAKKAQPPLWLSTLSILVHYSLVTILILKLPLPWPKSVGAQVAVWTLDTTQVESAAAECFYDAGMGGDEPKVLVYWHKLARILIPFWLLFFLVTYRVAQGLFRRPPQLRKRLRAARAAVASGYHATLDGTAQAIVTTGEVVVASGAMTKKLAVASGTTTQKGIILAAKHANRAKVTSVRHGEWARSRHVNDMYKKGRAAAYAREGHSVRGVRRGLVGEPVDHIAGEARFALHPAGGDRPGLWPNSCYGAETGAAHSRSTGFLGISPSCAAELEQRVRKLKAEAAALALREAEEAEAAAALAQAEADKAMAAAAAEGGAVHPSVGEARDGQGWVRLASWWKSHEEEDDEFKADEFKWPWQLEAPSADGIDAMGNSTRDGWMRWATHRSAREGEGEGERRAVAVRGEGEVEV